MNNKIKQFTMVISVAIFKTLLKCIYLFLKRLPRNNKRILFCSRQSDEIPLDFELLAKELNRKDSTIEFVFICKRINKGFKCYVSYFIVLLKSMYYLATSKVCILDTYWPTVSLLKHKRELKIIQLWHSIGKTKKSGFQTLDKKSGRKATAARMLDMHRNYDYVVGGAKIWNPYYCEAFDITEDKIINCGLPRIDYLLNTEQKNKEMFFEEFPQLKNKKIVLYAPTFRRNMKTHWQDITKLNGLNDIVIILKSHPSQREFSCKSNTNILTVDHWKTIDLIGVSDIVITDYSSIALEAAVLNKKTYYWTYDYDEYIKNNGTNINLKDELSGNMYEDINLLIDHIKKGVFNFKQYNHYRKVYLPNELGKSTEKLSTFILTLIKEDDIKNEVAI